MAHFYAEIQGNRGSATRIGTKHSGMWVHIRGWNRGIYVKAWVNEQGEDCFSIYTTEGSNNSTNRLLTTYPINT